MTWLFSQVWLWVLVSALLGFAITLFAMIGPARSARPAAVRPARSERNERSRPEPTGERSRHRAALTDESDDSADADDRTDGSIDTDEVTVRPVAGATSAAAAAAAEPAVEPAVEPAASSRRRRRYDVDDVEVSAWEPGAAFAAAAVRTEESAFAADPEPQPEPQPEPPASRYAPAKAEATRSTEHAPDHHHDHNHDPAVALFGADAASTRPDGSGPEGYPVKASGRSMKFHAPGSPDYDEVIADVWFRDEDAAAAAGFQHWEHQH